MDLVTLDYKLLILFIMTLLLGYKNFVWIKLFKKVLHCLENRKHCSWAKWKNILHRDLKLKSNNKFDSDDSDYASDNVNPLGNSDFHSFSPRKQVRASTATKSGVHFSAAKQTARGKGGNNKQSQTTTTRSAWQSLSTQTNGYVFVNPSHHIPFQEPNGLRRIAMFSTTVLAYFLLFFPMSIVSQVTTQTLLCYNQEKTRRNFFWVCCQWRENDVLHWNTL